MSFKKQKSSRRKLDAALVSNSAEICETRAMLSADAVSAPAAEVEAAADVTNDGEVAPVEDVDATTLENWDPSWAYRSFSAIEDDVDVKGEVVQEDSVIVDDAGDGEVVDENLDPAVMYYSFLPVDVGVDGEIVDEELVTCEVCPVYKGEGEELTVDGEEFVDVTTLEDYDPSWAYRSFSGIADDVTGEEVVEEELVDVTTLEDYDPSWAYRGGVSEGEEVVELNDAGGEEIADDFVLYPYDPVVLNDGGEVLEVSEEPLGVKEEIVEEDTVVVDGEVVTVRYLGGPQFRGNAAEETPDILMMSAGGPLVFGSSGSGVVGPVAPENPTDVPVEVTTVVAAPASLPVAQVSTPTLAIPVLQSSRSALFDDDENLSIGGLVSAIDDSEYVASDSVEETVSPVLDTAFGDLLSSTTQAEATGLDILNPILESESDEEPVVAPEASEIEEVTSDSEESVSAAEAYQPVPEPSYANVVREPSSGMIDRFMTEFALNSFVS